jgi:predicted esterase
MYNNCVSLEMFRKTLSGVAFICLCPAIYSQSKTLYKDKVFIDLSIQQNLSYTTNIPPEARKKSYRFDFYEASKDTSTARPLIIWMHGGGFKFGSKRAKGIRMWSKDFAARGYVCAAINYRLSKQNPLRNFKALVNGCYKAIEDVEQAIAFFKINNKVYRIDANRIILAGNSAGAIVALHSVYSNSADLKRLMQIPDSTPHQRYNSNNVAAVINFWGALFNAEWLSNTDVPIVSAHGKKDRIVPYKCKDSTLYGSLIIHQKADSLRIPNQLKSYDRYGHELQKHFIPILRSGATRRRWLEAGQFAADFLHKQLWK